MMLLPNPYKAMNATMAEIMAVSTPSCTPTWSPIPHHVGIEMVKERMDASGYQIIREAFGLSKDGKKLFGVIDIQRQNECLSVGIRNSHNKLFGFGITVGARVLACDNLVMAGQKTISKKHRGDNLAHVISDVFCGLEERYNTLVRRIEELKGMGIVSRHASQFIIDVAHERGITSSNVLPIYEEFINPSCTEFRAQSTMFSLLMAFTEVAKEFTGILKLMTMYKALGKKLGL